MIKKKKRRRKKRRNGEEEEAEGEEEKEAARILSVLETIDSRSVVFFFLFLSFIKLSNLRIRATMREYVCKEQEIERCHTSIFFWRLFV